MIKPPKKRPLKLCKVPLGKFVSKRKIIKLPKKPKAIIAPPQRGILPL